MTIMKIITQKELVKILNNHQHYLKKDCKDWKSMRANLSNADLSNADLSNADLSYANLSCADLSGANLTYAKLTYANLSGAKLSNANLTYANLFNANLNGAKLSYAKLSYAKLSNADLSDADLFNAKLSNANLTYAKLFNAKLNGAKLNGANLTYANLSCANLNGADLSYANLSNADLSNAIGYLIEYRKGKILTEPIIGYKKCRDSIIVTLEIPADAIVFSINGNKCRTNKCKVIAIEGINEAISIYNSCYTYTVGKEIIINDFDLQYNVECRNGIHFFLTKEEAINYSF